MLSLFSLQKDANLSLSPFTEGSAGYLYSPKKSTSSHKQINCQMPVATRLLDLCEQKRDKMATNMMSVPILDAIPCAYRGKEKC
jgi:hypothetical protein